MTEAFRILCETFECNFYVFQNLLICTLLPTQRKVMRLAIFVQKKGSHIPEAYEFYVHHVDVKFYSIFNKCAT